jgi:hypothetical protein
VISAGIATYGTWKNAYAVAQPTKASSTQAASKACESRSGAANSNAKQAARASPPPSRNGLRGPLAD